MTVYSIRYYAQNWHHALAAGEEAQTLPQLGANDRAIATRMDVPGTRYWGGSSWSGTMPAALAALTSKRATAEASKKGASFWLDEHRDELNRRARALEKAMPAISNMDVTYPSQRLRDWIGRHLEEMGAPGAAYDMLRSDPRRWLTV